MTYKEDIKILENLLEEGFEAMCYSEAQAIEHLIKGYKEEKERYKQSKQYREKNIEVTNLYLNSIPVSLVKETIERLKEQYKTALEENSIKAFILKCQIEILKELLEGE